MTSEPAGRRLSSPVRFTLATELGDGLDGAWWPHSASIARELPELIEALREPLGQVVDIGLNWSPLEGVPDLDLLNRRGVAATPGRETRRFRVMTITGSDARANLLVGTLPDEYRAGHHAAASGRRPSRQVRTPTHLGIRDRRRHRGRRARSRRAERSTRGDLQLKYRAIRRRRW